MIRILVSLSDKRQICLGQLLLNRLTSQRECNASRSWRSLPSKFVSCPLKGGTLSAQHRAERRVWKGERKRVIYGNRSFRKLRYRAEDRYREVLSSWDGMDFARGTRTLSTVSDIRRGAQTRSALTSPRCFDDFAYDTRGSGRSLRPWPR